MQNRGNQPHNLPSLDTLNKEYSYCLRGSSLQGQQRYLTPRENQDFIFFLSVSYWLLLTNHADCRPATESLLPVFLLASPSLPLHGTGTCGMPPRGWAALQFVSILTPLCQDSKCFFVSNSKALYQEAIFTGQYPEAVLYKSNHQRLWGCIEIYLCRENSNFIGLVA